MKLRNIIGLLRGLLVAALIAIGLLVIFSVFPLSGYQLLVVQSGSMEPAIKMGSVVLVAPKKAYKVDEVITYKEATNPRRSVTHRIVEVKQEGETTSYVTKGDRNDAPDITSVAKENIVGSVRVTIPWVGYLVNTAKKPFGFIFLIVIPATIIIYEELKKIKREVIKLRVQKKEVEKWPK